MVGIYLSDWRVHRNDLHALSPDPFLPVAVIGMVLTVALIGFWLIVVSKTLMGMWHGNLFQAPCLAITKK